MFDFCQVELLQVRFPFLRLFLWLFGFRFAERRCFVLEDELSLIDIFESLLLAPLRVMKRVRASWVGEGEIPAMGH